VERARVGSELSARLRDPTASAHAVLRALADGHPVERAALERALGADLVARGIDAQLLLASGEHVRFEFALGIVHDVVCARPDDSAAVTPERRRNDFLYAGPDSMLLAEATHVLAPSGERAAELGTGTGLLAAMLTRTYHFVVATDVVPRAAAAARLTLELNPRAPTFGAGAVVADIARGLRAASFDLVVANPPWVPTDGASPRVFADGGTTGVELPIRFMRAAARLLRPGGVAVVLALDVETQDGDRPIADVCTELSRDGRSCIVVATPIDRMLPELETKMRERQHLLRCARHVAVIIGAPHANGAPRYDLVAGAEALRRKWKYAPGSSTRK
jgi:SAM-dependent methyltransferase